MKNPKKVNTMIRGFNRETSNVTAIRNNKREVIGWQFTARCGTNKKYYEEYFHDPRSAAIQAMETHQHR